MDFHLSCNLLETTTFATEACLDRVYRPYRADANNTILHARLGFLRRLQIHLF